MVRRISSHHSSAQRHNASTRRDLDSPVFRLLSVCTQHTILKANGWWWWWVAVVVACCHSTSTSFFLSLSCYIN